MLEKLQKLVDESGNIVFFGGAGVSTESGIRDFRSADGLYSQKYDYPPEYMLSRSFFLKHPEAFYAFHRDKLIAPQARPNAAHDALARLEAAGKLKAVITQNIDGLHQMAGSRNVLELHGSVHRNYCQTCGKLYDAQFILDCPGVPYCACGGLIRPDVVLYEESLDHALLRAAGEYIRRAELLIVGGTSLAVSPAAGLIEDYAGDKLVLINRDATPLDSRAELVIQGSIGQVLGALRLP